MLWRPGQGTTSSMSRAGSLMSRASSQGLSERLGSLGLTLDGTSVYSESGVPQSPSARSIASSRPPPSLGGYSKGPPPPGLPQGPPGPSPNSSPAPGGGAGGAPRGTGAPPASSPFGGRTSDDAPPTPECLIPTRPQDPVTHRIPRYLRSRPGPLRWPHPEPPRPPIFFLLQGHVPPVQH